MLTQIAIRELSACWRSRRCRRRRCCSPRAAPPAKLTGGTGTLYIGGWPNKIFIVDEATEKVTGAIDVTTGHARAASTLSKDKKHFYLVELASAKKSRSSTSRRGRASTTSR